MSEIPPAGADPPNRILPKRKTRLGWAITTVHYRSLPPGAYDYETASQGLDEAGKQTELEVNWYASKNKIVYNEYSDNIHLAQEPLEFDPELPLHCGFDVPGCPAFVPTQVNRYGQWEVYPSLHPHPGTSMSVYEFGQRVADHLLQEYALPHGLTLEDLKLVMVGDPAGKYRPVRTGARRQETRAAWEVLSLGSRLYLGEDERGAPQYEELPGWGWHFVPGAIDNPTRQEAVRSRLTRILPGGLPAFVLCPRADFLRHALQGGYSYKRFEDGTYSRDPDKNWESHVCNALEYVATRLSSQPIRSRAPGLEEDEPEGFVSRSSGWHRLR